MSRRVITTQLQAAGAAEPVDGYFDKVVKFIPADIVGAWIFVSSAIKAASNIPVNTLLWIAFVALLAITPLWTWRRTQLPDKPNATTQIIIATAAFAVWVFALGGPFATMGFYRPLYGSLVLVLYTLMIGLINPRELPSRHRPKARGGGRHPRPLPDGTVQLVRPGPGHLRRWVRFPGARY